jgi:type VI secretion system protein ImpH
VSCLRQRMDIPLDQRLKLGGDQDGSGQGKLGEGAWLGQSMNDRMNHFLIRVGPLSADEYHQLLPGQPQYGWLRFLARFYQVGCLGSTLDLTLQAGSAKTACLGVVQWGRLGLDTWIFAGDYEEEVHAAFVLYK